MPLGAGGERSGRPHLEPLIVDQTLTTAVCRRSQINEAVRAKTRVCISTLKRKTGKGLGSMS